jgi:hypothetical protein
MNKSHVINTSKKRREKRMGVGKKVKRRMGGGWVVERTKLPSRRVLLVFRLLGLDV